MAGTPFTLFKLEVAGSQETYYFRARINKEWVESIQAETGITVATAKEQTKPRINVSELLRSETAVRVKVAVLAGGVTKYHNILVSASNVFSASVGLVDKSYGGGLIQRTIGKTSDKFS